MATLRSITPLIPAGDDLDRGVRFFTEELGFDVTWQGGSMAGVRRGQVEFNLVQNSNAAWAENASASIAVDDWMRSTPSTALHRRRSVPSRERAGGGVSST